MRLSPSDCQLLQKSCEYFKTKIALSEQHIFKLSLLLLLDIKIFFVYLVALMRQKVVRFHYRDVKGFMARIDARFILLQFFVFSPSLESIACEIFTNLDGIDA
jgi:hypothetical protein